MISATIGLFDIRAMTKLCRQDRFEFGVAAGTFAAVVALGILVGILTAVFLSLALLIARISRPRDAVLGPADDGSGFQEVMSGGALEAAPGVVVYRLDAPLFFANGDYFVDQAVEVFDRTGPERYVLDFEAVTLVDVTAARALKRLVKEIKARHSEVCVARASRAVHHQMDEAGLVEAIGKARFYPSVRAAVSGDSLRSPTATSGGRRRLTAPPAGPAHRGPLGLPPGGSDAAPPGDQASRRRAVCGRRRTPRPAARPPRVRSAPIPPWTARSRFWQRQWCRRRCLGRRSKRHRSPASPRSKRWSSPIQIPRR